MSGWGRSSAGALVGTNDTAKRATKSAKRDRAMLLQTERGHRNGGSHIVLMPRALGARSLLLLVHDALDELEDLRRAGGLRLAVHEGLAPVGDPAVPGQLVEEGARDLDADAGI